MIVRRWTLAAGFCLAALMNPGFSAGAAAQPAPAPDTTAPDTTAARIDDLTVTAEGMAWGEGTVPEGAGERIPGGNLAEILENLPGIAAIRRAPSGAEPVIRGLSWERVLTRLGAVPLYGACPGRMDPPATYLSPQSVGGVSVARGGGAAGFGPGATGGVIEADPDYERPAGAPPGFSPFAAAGYESAREGFFLHGGIQGGTSRFDLKASVGHRKEDDYEAPGGTLVPAGLTSASANLAGGLRLGDDRRLWASGSFVHEEDVDYPALPMDNIDTDFRVGNASYRVLRPGESISRIEITGGYSAVDHLMDNSMKPTAQAMPSVTDARTRSWGGHVQADVAGPGKARTTLGLDWTGLTRDAVRTRMMTVKDYLWPDAIQANLGGSVKAVIPAGGATRLSLQGRLDHVDSKARAANAASLGGLTVVQQWEASFGPDARDHDRTELIGAGSAVLSHDFGDRTAGYLRGGYSSRAAGVTERYYAFSPAPGGYQLGNPTLDAEKKQEAEAGLSWQGDRVTVAASAFFASFDDFILPQEVDRRDVNQDGTPDAIMGFVNTEARLYGGELGLELRPCPRLLVPVTVAHVRGENTGAGRDLPEIPPLSGTAEIRFQACAVRDAWLRAGVDFAADQDRIDPLFGENRTGGYAVWHLGASGRPLPGLSLGLLVENLFDRLYNDHLTREAALAVGGLLPGQEVPAPGRSVRLWGRMDF